MLGLPICLGFRSHVLEEAKLSRRDSLGMSREGVAGISLPGLLFRGPLHFEFFGISLLLFRGQNGCQQLGFVMQPGFYKGGMGQREAPAPHIDDLGPDVLATINADRLGLLLGEAVVVGLRQAGADHPERAEAPILEPMERLDTF